MMLNKESNPPSIKEALLTQLQLAPNMILDSNRITGYFFTNQQIQPMQMTDTGFTIETVNEVSTHIEAARAQIYSQLFMFE
jgi:hypothetical protein